MKTNTNTHTRDSWRNDFDLRRCVPMTREEEHRCATDYVETRSPALAERLISANLRLVVTIARSFRRANYDLRDLVQEGNLGLVHAVAHYDPSRGIKLSSYAAWWIRAYVMKYTMDNWRLVKTGTTQAQRRLFFRLNGERSRLERSGARIDSKQLAFALDVTEKDVDGMLERFAAGEASLDARRTPGGQDSRTIGDVLGIAPALQPDAQVEAAEFNRALRGKLKVFGGTLRGREADIFHRRLLNEQPVTLVHLAAGFGVSRERTRQLEHRLKGRIREYLTREMGTAVEPQFAAA